MNSQRNINKNSVTHKVHPIETQYHFPEINIKPQPLPENTHNNHSNIEIHFYFPVVRILTGV